MINQLRLGLVLLIASMAAHATPEAVVNELRGATYQLIQTLKEDEDRYRTQPDCLRDAVKVVTDRYFDMGRIARLSLGKYYRRINRGQRADFTIQFERLLLKTYGTVLLNNLDAKIDWGTKPTKDNDVIIARAKVDRGTGEPIMIDFYLKTSRYYEGHRIYDVKVEGVSLVTNYRSSFQKILRGRDGFVGLIDELDRKNRGTVCPLTEAK